EAGDVILAFDTTAAGVWRSATVATASSAAVDPTCTPSTGFLAVSDSVARRPVTRLVLDPPLSGGVTAGAPVRIVRRARYVLFRGSDGAWSLAYRPCDIAGICGTAQAVAGPLASPADSGLRFSLLPGGVGVDVAVRAPRHTSMP